MHLLIASIAALFFGPVLLRLLGRRGPVLAIIDGFVVVGLGGVLVAHLLPDSMAVAGVWAGLAAAVGVVTPPLLERGFARRSASISAVIISVAMVGLALHAVMDGAALALELEHGQRHAHDGAHREGVLAIAVMLHRVPIGLTIWWLVGRAKHARRGWMMLGVITLATVAGFVGAQPLLDAMPARGLGIAQALLAGLLFHAVFAHRPDLFASDSPHARRWALLGAALAGVGLWLADSHHAGAANPDTLEPMETFLTLALHGAPAMLLAFVTVGVLLGLMRQGQTQRLTGGNALSQVLRGSVFGSAMPVCSCGVVPVYRRLIKAGVPVAAAMAFLVATPALGMDALLIGVPMLGPALALGRLLCALLIAVLLGLLLGRMAPPEAVTATAPSATHSTESADANDTAATPWRERFRCSFAFGFGELFDHVAPWMVMGLFVASLVEPMMRRHAFTTMSPSMQVPMMAAMGLPMYVCASGATPMIAVLMHKGLSGGAAIAFLLTGPATNLVTFTVLSALHGRRVAIAFGGLVTGLAILLGLAVNAWLPTTALPLLALSEDKPSWLNIICLAALSLLLVVSIVRQGPRGFIEQLFSVDGYEHDHSHSHDHAHDHNHDCHGH